MALVSFDAAKQHIRRPDLDNGSPISAEAQELLTKMELATALVVNHIKRPNHPWSADTDPAEDHEFAIVQAMVLEVLANIWSHRGDDEKPVEGPLTERVIRSLSMLRDPAMA